MADVDFDSDYEVFQDSKKSKKRSNKSKGRYSPYKAGGKYRSTKIKG